MTEAHRVPKIKSMDTQENSARDSVESTNLLAVLWNKYQDAKNESRNALRMGDNPKALTLAICANKIRNEYDHECNKMFFR